MYEYIKGSVAEVAPAYAVIDAGGVGYYLHISLETYSAIEHETETRLYVHYVVREDAQLLYGFSTKAERELFRLLISVSGVGGNTARMILSTYSPRELQGIITAGNAVGGVLLPLCRHCSYRLRFDKKPLPSDTRDR